MTAQSTSAPPPGQSGPSSRASATFAPAGRRKWLQIGLLAVLITALAAAVLIRITDDDPAPPDTRPPVTTQLGVFRGNDPQQVSQFGDWLGRKVDYAVDFPPRQTWADISQPQPAIDTWKGLPYRVVYSIALLPDDPRDTIERGATGEYDKYFADLAQRLVAAGQQTAILRLGWEFNIADSRWSTADSKAFVSYWRHVVAAFRTQPGAQFQFDWNPNNGDAKYDAVNYYPGNDVVDYIGVDAYDVSWAADSYPYPENCDAGCRTDRQQAAWDNSIFGGARGLKFWSKFAARQGKPLTLPEWGLWQREDQHGGGDDPDYLRRISAFVADPANRVAYQAYFEFDGPDGPHRLMTSFPQAGDVFKSLFAKPAPATS
jgi:hypothetical protein